MCKEPGRGSALHWPPYPAPLSPISLFNLTPPICFLLLLLSSSLVSSFVHLCHPYPFTVPPGHKRKRLGSADKGQAAALHI